MIKRFIIYAAGCLSACGLIFAGPAAFAAHGGGGFGGGGGGHFGGGGFGGGGHFGGGGGFGGGHFGGGPAFGGGGHVGGIGGGGLAGRGGFGGGLGGGHFGGGNPGAHGFGGGHFGGPSFGGVHGGHAGAHSFAGVHNGHFGGASGLHGHTGRSLSAAGHNSRFGHANAFHGRNIALGNIARGHFAGGANRHSFASLHNRNAVAGGNNHAFNNHAVNSLHAGVANGIGRQRVANNASFSRGNAFANERFGGHRWGNRGFRRFWAGGVFWPFFVGDYFSYAFWPDYYYDSFWGYGPDALLWGAFWPDYAYPDYDYGYYGAGYPGVAYEGDIYSRYRRRHAVAARRPERVARVTSHEAQASCAGFAPGVEDLPIARVEDIIQPNAAQGQAFDELKAAMQKAAYILSNACPAEIPANPVARLDAMEQRLKAMEQAQETIRGPLERLYALLSPEQRQRLEAAIEGSQGPVQASNIDLKKLCSSQAGFTNVPENDIEQSIRLTHRQVQDLDNLKRISAIAAGQLRRSCPTDIPATLDARLNAAHERIEALIQAIDTIRPAAGTFFASLSDAQRTALNSQAPLMRTASNRRR